MIASIGKIVTRTRLLSVYIFGLAGVTIGIPPWQYSDIWYQGALAPLVGASCIIAGIG